MMDKTNKAMIVTRYRPAYYSGFDKEQSEFNSKEELLSVPWINGLTKSDSFHRLSVSRRTGRPILMLELDEGREFWAIGFIEGEGDLSWLPNWENNEKYGKQ